MTSLHIRLAAATDADAVARLVHQLGYPTDGVDMWRRVERMAADGRAVALVAETAAGVVGFATAHILSVVVRPRDVAWLTTLVVEEAVRRTGVGRALVRAVEDFARRSGCERLSVTTHEHRADAQSFYMGVGLEHTGRRYGKPLIPAGA